MLILALSLSSNLNAQEIDVQSFGTAINDGGAGTPSLTNQTDFGSTNEQGGTITKTFEIRNVALLGNLTLGAFTFGGTNASDFTLTKAPAATVGALGGSTTFEVTFNPSALGARTATISFVTNDGNENPFNFNLSGTGSNFPTQAYTVYYENFDETNGNWLGSGANGSWTWDNTIHRGEGKFWRTNSNYSNNSMIFLTSPKISTAGYNNVKISLDIRFDTSNDLNDGMQIQYSTNNGSTWNVLGTNTENWCFSTTIAALNVAGSGAVTPSGNGWNNTGATIAAPFSQFEEKSTQMNLLDNQLNLRFRVVFASNGSNIDVGVAIDNVIIKGDPITPFANPSFGPGSINNNLKLWLKANAGTNTTIDGATLNTWSDQAFDNHAGSIGTTKPTFRDGTLNINFNPIVDFSAAGGNVMKGKGGFWAQDYFVVVKTNNTVNNSAAARQVPISGRTAISSFHLDGTAFAFGNFTARYANEMISHSINSVPQTASTNSYGRAYVSTTDSYVQETIIYNIKRNSAGTQTEIYKNGQKIDNTLGQAVAADQVTFTGNLNFSEFQNLQYNLGTGRFSLNGNAGSFLDGKLSEIISYSNPNTAADKKKIESYLAVKNGITLHDINSTTAVNLGDTDYVDSNGSVIWSTAANTGFNFDIAGIGRDDNTQLNQKQSKSENPNTVLTIGIGDIAATNNLNTNTFAINRNFLMWGSNGATMMDSGVNLNIDLGPTTITTITEIVNRRWKVNEVNGDVPTTRVAIPTAAFVSGLPALGPTDAYVMVVATNSTFTTGLETVFMSTIGSNETCLYDFDGTKYITFGVAHRATNSLHVTLDGFDDYVRIADANEIGSTFSIMTWIRPNGNNTLNNERTIIAKTTATNGYKLVLQNDNKIRMEWTVAGVTQSAITTTALPNAKWHNIAVTYDSNNIKIYIDGLLDFTKVIAITPVNTTSTFSIGAQYINKTAINNLFKGDIDELRIWNRVVTETEIRFIMNQEINQNGTGTIGTIIPSTVTKNDISTLLWSNLFAYYSMNSYIGTHLDDDSFNNNRGSLVIPDKISINAQTAPMPYISAANGLWSSNASWTNGATQDLPYSLSIINNLTPIDWNIVKTTHNINSTGNKLLLGLFVDANTLSQSNDSGLEISHYLKLTGKIDLMGKSQLIQRLNSDLDPTSPGSIERDQQGQNSIYNYNYWSSPVGAINATTNNNSYTVASVFKDGTTSTPQNIAWTGSYNGSPTSPITLSNYWIYKFQNVSAVYANWQYAGPNGTLSASQGFTLKGSGSATSQNYTFVGKPNNGLITTPIAANNQNLSGNPYASALDSNAFITANASSITGTLYFWEHYATNSSHNLAAYQGGYATRTIVGGTPPVAPVGISGSGSSSKIPSRYIPVGQGFFVKGSAIGGNIVFNNNQREFVKEDDVNSYTLFKNTTSMLTAEQHFSNNTGHEVRLDEFIKIRLGYDSADGFHRQTLIGFMNENATNAIDPGYDGELIDNQPSDMYILNNNVKLNISGEGTFNQTQIFPLGIKANTAGTIKFLIDELENFPENVTIYIYDNQTNIYHNISTSQAQISVPQGVNNTRFSLRFMNEEELLGNNNFNNNNNIDVIYNQASNTVSIKNNSTTTTVENVELYNMLGQQMGTFDVKNQTQTNITLPLKTLSTGTYIVKIKTDKGNSSKKIIIN